MSISLKLVRGKTRVMVSGRITMIGLSNSKVDPCMVSACE